MGGGLILFAHGSPDPRWSEPLHGLAGRVRALQPGRVVRIAYLERQTPTLAEVIEELAPAGGPIDVAPVFWAANGHVQRDLPVLLEEARRRHPGLELRLGNVLSQTPGLLDFLARRLAS